MRRKYFRHLEYLGPSTPPPTNLLPDLGLQVSVGWRKNGMWRMVSLETLLQWLQPILSDYVQVDLLWAACSSLVRLKDAKKRALSAKPTVPLSPAASHARQARYARRLPSHIRRAERFAELDRLGPPELLSRSEESVCVDQSADALAAFLTYDATPAP